MPYYAVAKGSKTGVYSNWGDCKEQVHGYSGASYKKFSTAAEANAFVQSGANQDQVHLIVPEVDHQVEFLVLVAHQVVILVVILVVIPVVIPVATLVVAQSVLLPLQHLLLLLLLIVFMLMVLQEEMDKPARLHQDMVFIMVLMIQEMLLFPWIE